MKYAFFDGDNIGNKIEILLQEDNVSDAMKFSESIKSVILDIEKFLNSINIVKIILIGGDDVLIQINEDSYMIEIIDTIRSKFITKTGNSMSCGVGSTIQEAIWNLHIAKLYGKNIVKGIDIL